MRHLERALDGQNQIWKYIVLFLVAFLGGQMIGSIPLISVLGYKIVTAGSIGHVSPENMMDLSSFGISSNLGLALMLVTFIGIFSAFALLVKPFHKRTVIETVNGRNHIRKDRIAMGILVWGILLLVNLGITLLTVQEGEMEMQFNLAQFIPLLFIVLFLMPFQTTVEEILFRGYLTQGIAAHTRSRWAALISVSLLFGLMHIANPEVREFGFWLSMPQYVLMGLLLGLVSILDDGIEIAIGIHFANNAFSALFVTYRASVLQTDAVFKLNKVNPELDLLFLSMAAIVAVFVFAKIYQWNLAVMNQKVNATPPPLPPIVEPGATNEIISDRK